MQKHLSTGFIFTGVVLYAALVLLLSGCATGSNQKLVLDTREVPAVGHLPKEVTSMLESLGYEVIPETDDEKYNNTFKQYNMRFKARDEENVRVDVQFMLVDRLTRMHLYNVDEKTPGTATKQRYNELKRHVEQVFGVDSVK